MERIKGILIKKFKGLTNIIDHEIWNTNDLILHIRINKQKNIRSITTLNYYGNGLKQAKKTSTYELTERETMETWEFDRFHTMVITMKNNLIQEITLYKKTENDYKKMKSIIGNGIRWHPEIMKKAGK